MSVYTLFKYIYIYSIKWDRCMCVYMCVCVCVRSVIPTGAQNEQNGA